MGKYILLVVLAGSLGVSILAYQGQQTSLETTEGQAEHEEGVLAKQITQSAFESGVRELEGEIESCDAIPPDRTGVEYEGGTYDLTFEEDCNQPLVTLTAVGHFGGASYQISADVVPDIDGFPPIGEEGPSDVDPKGDSHRGSGKDTDPVPPGESPDVGSGSGMDRHGMRLSDEGTANDAQNEYDSDDERIEGIGGTGDIVNEPIEIDLQTVADEIKTAENYHGDLDGTIGSSDDPAYVVVEDNVDLKGDVHGTGALLVEGDFTMRGNAQWDGLVLVIGGNSTVDDTDIDNAGNARVFGSLMKYNPDDSEGSLTLRGNVRLQYSSEALRVLDEELPTIEEESETQVVDRTGCRPENCDK